MSKKNNLSAARSWKKPEDLYFSNRDFSEERKHLNTFRNRAFQLKEDVNRLGFMISEIQDVLATSAKRKAHSSRFLA